MLKNDKKFNYYFGIYIAFLCFCSIYFLSTSYDHFSNNAISEWLINYQGGFVRRGFFGEFFAQISLFIKIPLREVIVNFLYLIFFIYYISIFLFIKNIQKNYFIVIALLSPLFLIWPIAEREALGRKELLIFLAFIFFSYIYNYLSFRLLLILLIFINTPILLTHEIAIFYLPFFYIVLFFKIEKINLEIIILIIFSIIFFLFIIYIIYNSKMSSIELELMCSNIEKIFNEKCGLGAYFLDKDIEVYLNELGPKPAHLLRNLLIFLIGYIFLIFLIFFSKFNETKNIIFSIFNYQFVMIFLFLPTIIPFFIAVDWGRWFNISYTMLLLFYLFCFKNKIISFNKTNKVYFYLSKKFCKNKTILFLSIFLICFTWNPKAVYNEDIGSIPIYRILAKLHKHL